MMFRYRSRQALVVVTMSLSLSAATSLVRSALAATGDVVDLEADTHHNPPASTTDKSTPLPAPTTESEIAIEKDTKEINDAAKEEAAEEELKLRAGERVGDAPRGTAQVLGMSLQEGPQVRVKVVEVAPNSPAFVAGVMKGDEIIAFQGFRGESYRKWIDGIRRLTADTRSGLKIPVLVARDGERLTVRIVVPDRTVLPLNSRGVAQPGSPLVPPGIGPAFPTPGSSTVAVVNGGNNVAIANSGPFGEFFGGQAATANERAMAQIFRIGGNPTTNVAGSAAAGNPASVRNSAAGATTPIRGGVRIGLAGFRDNPSGMVVMVDVGALPPGNYTVGISDPSIIGGVTGTGAVQDTIPTTGQERPSTNPPTGEVSPSSTPPTGQINPSSSTPTGQSSVNNAQRAEAAQPATEAGPNNIGVVGGTLSQIGTITIDQSGTGRMQQTVESVRVRDVVGQAIVLYSQGGSPETTLPANLDGSAGAATQLGASDSPSARGSQPAADASGGQGSAASQPAALQQATVGSQVPVAGGIIQLVNDRRPPETTVPQTSQTPAGTNRADEQPASATPPAVQNFVR